MTAITSAQAQVSAIAARYGTHPDEQPAPVRVISPHAWRRLIRVRLHDERLAPLGNMMTHLLLVALDMGDQVDADDLEADYSTTPRKGRARASMFVPLSEYAGVSKAKTALALRLLTAGGIIDQIEAPANGRPGRYRLGGSFDPDAMLHEALCAGVKLETKRRDMTVPNKHRESRRTLHAAGVDIPGETDDVTPEYDTPERVNDPVDNPGDDGGGSDEPGGRHDDPPGSRGDDPPGGRHDDPPSSYRGTGEQEHSFPAYWSSYARAHETPKNKITIRQETRMPVDAEQWLTTTTQALAGSTLSHRDCRDMVLIAMELAEAPGFDPDAANATLAAAINQRTSA